MKSKFENIAVVEKQLINAYLPPNEAAAQARLSKGFYSALPLINRQLQAFLQYCVGSRHEMVKAMLKNPFHFKHWLFLFTKRMSVMDYSGREFSLISGFEYSLWALDKFLWNDILDCLPRDEEGHLTDEGKTIVTELQQQYLRVKNIGVTYRLNGILKTESHYDFALIDELQKQVIAHKTDGNKDWGAINTQWRKGVGGAQRLLPMHVVSEYCSKTPFDDPTPQFNSRGIPAHGIGECGYSLGEYRFWFADNAQLGVNFGVQKGDMRSAWSTSSTPFLSRVINDLTVITALLETRKSDFITLHEQLESLLAFEEQLRPGI